MNAVVASNPLPARGHDVGETAGPLARSSARPSAQCPHAYATQRRRETTLDACIEQEVRTLLSRRRQVGDVPFEQSP